MSASDPGAAPRPGSVALVIPARNDEATLPAVLEAACSQGYPDLEIVVVDNASEDGTAAVAARFPRARLLRNETNLGLCRNMRRGVDATRSEFVAIVHADCRIEGTDWVERMLEPLGDPRVAAVMSQRRVPQRGALKPGSRLFDTVSPQALENKAGRLAEARYTSGKADLYRRSALEGVGCWDCAAFRNSGEDRDLSQRLRTAGHAIVLSDRAWVTNLFSGRQRSVVGALKKATLYGGSAAVLYARHGYDGLRARIFLATWLAALAAASPMAAGHRGWGACAVFYAAAIFFSRGAYAERRTMGKRIPLLVLPAAGAALLAGAAIAAGPGPLPPEKAGFLALPYGLFLLLYAARSVRLSLAAGDGWLFQVPVLCFSIVWRLASGIGYGKAWLGLDRGRRRSMMFTP